MTTTYLSIDVATKSLAIGIYEINVDNIDENIDLFIKPVIMNIHDLNPEKNAKDMNIDDKAKSLKKILNNYDQYIKENVEVNVLIEYQMNANYMSNAIYNMIIYHYANLAKIHVVHPTLKNSIYFNKNLKHSDFLATANNNYSANKNHCKYNFLYFMFIFDHSDKLKHIKQKNLDDVADTFMQCVAFHKRKLSNIK